MALFKVLCSSMVLHNEMRAKYEGQIFDRQFKILYYRYRSMKGKLLSRFVILSDKNKLCISVIQF